MTTTPARRMRSHAVTLGVTALMAAGLTGCATSADYAAVCVDPATEQRVDDDQCDDDREYDGTSSGFFWYYLAASRAIPSVGSPVSGGTFRSSGLSGTVQRGGLPREGGTTVKSATSKGGFGGSGRSSS
ncbi:hypothetical protein [Nocardioides flavescens]